MRKTDEIVKQIMVRVDKQNEPARLREEKRENKRLEIKARASRQKEKVSQKAKQDHFKRLAAKARARKQLDNRAEKARRDHLRLARSIQTANLKPNKTKRNPAENPNTDLTWSDVNEIRSSFDKSKGIDNAFLAYKYGVSSACISRIINGLRWVI